MKKQKKSEVWDYFELISEKNEDNKEITFTKCLIENCGVKLVYCQTTSSMTKHIKTVHPTKYKEIMSEKDQNNQAQITEEAFKMKAMSKEKTQLIHRSLACFLAMELKPINIVESEGFKKFIHTLEPRYVLPTRAYLRESIFPDLFKT